MNTDYDNMNDIEYAKAVARRMFELYDKNHNSQLEGEEVVPIMQDVYKSMNKLFNPTQLDVNTYSSVLDSNHDGRVTLADLEDLCIRYLAGEAALAHSKTNAYKTYQETINKAAYPTYPTFLDNTISPIKHESPLSVTVPSPNPYSNALKRSTYTNTYEKSLKNSGQLPKNAATAPIGGISSIGAMKSSIGGTTSVGLGNIGKTSGSFEQIKRVFDKFDTDKNGLIDQAELKYLMEETYRHLGITRNVSQSDIQSYLRFADTNRDGFISYPEYESIVIKALGRINFTFAY